MAAATNQLTVTYQYRTPPNGPKHCTAIIHSGKGISRSNGARNEYATFDRNKVKSIDQRHKHLISGFIREHDEKVKRSTPVLIHYMALMYWYETDEFNVNELCYMKLVENRIKWLPLCYNSQRRPRAGHYRAFLSFAFLSNAVSEGEHIWKFRIVEPPSLCRFMIRRKDWDCWDDGDKEPHHVWMNGPDVYSINGFRDGTDPHLSYEADNHGDRVQSFPLRCGDVVEMIVNLYQLTLTYKCNGLWLNWWTDIQADEYVAGVELGKGEVELLSYHPKY